jgi:AbrB family looped-hinge helix DNA binding protein
MQQAAGRNNSTSKQSELQVRLCILLAQDAISCRMSIMLTKVTKRGQVSVPADVRKKLQIGPGTRLQWIIEGSTARVIPLPADPLRAFRGSGRKGLVKILLDDRRSDRRQEEAG